MHTQLIQEIYEAFNAKDYPAVLERFHRNMEWNAAESSPLSDRSPYHGLQQVKEGVFDRIAASFDYLRVQIDEMMLANDKLVVLGYYHALLKGKGKPFQAQLAHIWTIQDGRIIKFQQYTDTHKIAQALQ